MNLLFPQWQGAGNLPALRQGAEQLARARPEANWHPLAVDTGPPSDAENGIRAYRQLEAQLGIITELLKAKRPDTLFTLGATAASSLRPSLT